MNHHLSEGDAAWIDDQGEFAITGWRGPLALNAKARLQELNTRTRMLARFEKQIGGVRKAADYFEVSAATWRAWRCGDRIPPAAVCFHLQKI